MQRKEQERCGTVYGFTTNLELQRKVEYSRSNCSYWHCGILGTRSAHCLRPHGESRIRLQVLRLFSSVIDRRSLEANCQCSEVDHTADNPIRFVFSCTTAQLTLRQVFMVDTDSPIKPYALFPPCRAVGIQPRGRRSKATSMGV